MSQIIPDRSSITQTSHPKEARQYAAGIYSFWKFSRPHTIIGTTLSVLGLYLTAQSAFNGNFHLQLWQLLGTWIACLCGNIYIVGLNQLEDIEIDRINKPHLPLAAGEFSRRQAQLIVAITGILALLFAWVMGPFLLLMVSISLAIGTAYSLPPIRLKRFPFWAALCIFSVRGAIVNIGLFLHFNQKLHNAKEIIVTGEVWALTLFILVFTFAIAIFKDVPDIEGDRQYNISTFTIKLGAVAVFNLARWVLTVCYVGMSVAAILYLASVNQVFLIGSHLIMLVLMWWRSRNVDLHDRSAISQFYQFIWKLFFLEYLIFPAACLLN